MTLRQLTIRDDAFVEGALASDAANVARSGLDHKTHALARLAALIAVGAAEPSYRQVVHAALESGATVDEVVGTLIAVMPVTGVPRAIAAAPEVGLAIGYDVHAALEEREILEGRGW